MKTNIEYLYEKNNILKIIINIKKGFIWSLGYLLTWIFTLLLGIFIIWGMILGQINQKLIEWSVKDKILMILLAIFVLLVGARAMYQWIKYNFGKEIIILNNSDKSLIYQKLALGFEKKRVFDYSNISKIVAEEQRGRCVEYYSCLIYKNEEFRFGILNDIIEAKFVVIRINDFMVR